MRHHKNSPRGQVLFEKLISEQNRAVDRMQYVDLSGEVLSVDRVGGYWRVLWNGKITRTFVGVDAECQAMGYAMALSDERERRIVR